MKGIHRVVLILTLLLLSSIVQAKEKLHNFGFGVDVGIPAGAALSFVYKPNISWLRTDVAATTNGLAPGYRTGITIDPIDSKIVPTFNIEYGHTFAGKIPYERTSLSYDYVVTNIGLDIGTQSKFRFFLRGGPSWIWMNAYNVNNLFGHSYGIKFYNTHINLILPTANLGMVYFF